MLGLICFVFVFVFWKQRNVHMRWRSHLNSGVTFHNRNFVKCASAAALLCRKLLQLHWTVNISLDLQMAVWSPTSSVTTWILGLYNVIIHRRMVIKDDNAVVVLKLWHYKVIIINGECNIYQWSMYNAARTYDLHFCSSKTQNHVLSNAGCPTYLRVECGKCNLKVCFYFERKSWNRTWIYYFITEFY